MPCFDSCFASIAKTDFSLVFLRRRDGSGCGTVPNPHLGYTNKLTWNA